MTKETMKARSHRLGVTLAPELATSRHTQLDSIYEERVPSTVLQHDVSITAFQISDQTRKVWDLACVVYHSSSGRQKGRVCLEQHTIERYCRNYFLAQFPTSDRTS